MWGLTSFRNNPKFHVDSENSKKDPEKFFGFEIIDFELVALNTSFYWENILVIGCHYANKESQDFIYF